MDPQRLVSEGQVATVTFGPTFVVIEGFSIRDDKTLQWWLRLAKDFSVSYGGVPSEWHSIDISEGRLKGVEILTGCVGQDVAYFSVNDGGLELRFANKSALRMRWSEGELSCAQLDAAETGKQGYKLILMMTFPKDVGRLNEIIP